MLNTFISISRKTKLAGASIFNDQANFLFAWTLWFSTQIMYAITLSYFFFFNEKIETFFPLSLANTKSSTVIFHVKLYNLMMILFCYRTSNIKDGTIKMNGRDRNISTFRKLSAYIMQDNQLHGNLTVEEAMTVAANLKLSTKVSKKDKMVVVSSDANKNWFSFSMYGWCESIFFPIISH